MTDDPVFAKCAWRLIPFIFVLYLFNFVDRVNVGFAALTMNTDLGFSPAVSARSARSARASTWKPMLSRCWR